MLFFIDTNIFLRTLVKDDEQKFNDCVSLLTKIKENKIKAVTSTIVLAEVVWTLGSYYRFIKKDILKAVKSIINLRGLKIIDKYDPLLTLVLYGKYQIKFIDGLIASISEIQAKKMTVISYDQDFDKLPIIRQEPEDIT